ncbi:hypothetical protein [Modestobacter versicolor]|uniref:Uncharacterized protein n=1 Tax=Modestobacter versicolor TaxID=429133 RepID=A0A323VFG1_9ACTN|nr:hypothetical protein [Modestobacter versicolor]MBB3676645.1 hypothetical protein [Modestobacter versicolor]PZA23385.1 hypothetical protein DMO24_00095 [Modestobacter versicolor]
MLPLVAAGALYVLVCAVLGGSLPESVPVLFDRDLVASRFVGREAFLLLATAVGAGVAVLTAAAVALVRWYAPTATARQAELRRLVAADLLQLGTATLVFLSLELALAYGPGDGGGDQPASMAVTDVVHRLPSAAVVALVAHLVWLLWWAGWRLPRRYRRPAARTADSVT